MPGDTGYGTVQIDVSAVSWVIAVFYLSCCFIIRSLTDAALLAASEYLEHIAAIEVDSDRTPYLGILTLTSTKDVECLT